MVHQLEAIDLCHVMYLLETTRQIAHILEALLDEISNQKLQNILMELSDGQLSIRLQFALNVRCALMLDFLLVTGLAVFVELRVPVKSNETQMHIILVLHELIDLLFDLRCLARCKHFELKAVRKAHFILELS